MLKIQGFYKRYSWWNTNDSYAISIGFEDARIYKGNLRQAKRLALDEHGVRESDVEWHDLDKSA